MGPGPADLMSSDSSIKILSLPKLQANGENWVMYKERLRNHLTSKGLIRHVNGTAKKPAEVEVINDKVHKKGNPVPMDDDELETYYDSFADYEQKEVQVRDVIYETIPKTIFLQVKGQPTAAKVIGKLLSIFEQKGQATIQETLNKLTNLRYTDGSSMHAHVGTMFEIRERLAEMGYEISDEQFATYIRTSLTPTFRSLLTAMNAAAQTMGKPVALDALVSAIIEEAEMLYAEKKLDEQSKDSAMMASKGKGKRSGKFSKEEKKKLKCDNCNFTEHTKDKCFAKGGGRENEAPDWWKEKFGKDKNSKGKTPTANAATEESIESANYSFLADDDVIALTCTSDFHEEALKANVVLRSVVIDSGASRHFSPDRSNMINFRVVEQAPIRAADGRIFSATGMGDMQIAFPNGNKSTNVLLKDVYYSPHLAFTLVSVTRMTHARFKVLMEDTTCTIYNPTYQPIAQIPEARGLYRISGPPGTPPIPANISESANLTSKSISIDELHR
jgi:hypothetical protein